MFALRPVPKRQRPAVLLLRLRQRSVPPCPQPSLLVLLEECKPAASHEDLRAPMSLPRMSRTSSVRALGSDLARAIAPSSPSPQLSMSAQGK